MRAGPLSSPGVIRLLKKNFVSTWILNGQLATVRDGASADASRLAREVLSARQVDSPVDCMVLTPDATLVAVRSVHQVVLANGNAAVRYEAFLEGALRTAKK